MRSNPEAPCAGGLPETYLVFRNRCHDGVMRALVVEDEPVIAAAVAAELAADGLGVDVAHDGADGLWRARELAYDVIVLDIMLPTMSGYQVCAALRAEGNHVPILMLTAKDGDFDEAEAFETGADDYLRKPFSNMVLVARVRSLLRRADRSPLQSETLEVGDLVLDLRKRTCAVAGESVELTQREFGVLESLAGRPGQVWGRQELLDRVWGPDFGGDANIIEVYIGYLRRKIDKPFGRRSLRTVRGVGYALSMPEPADGPTGATDG